MSPRGLLQLQSRFGLLFLLLGQHPHLLLVFSKFFRNTSHVKEGFDPDIHLPPGPFSELDVDSCVALDDFYGLGTVDLLVEVATGEVASADCLAFCEDLGELLIADIFQLCQLEEGYCKKNKRK